MPPPPLPNRDADHLRLLAVFHFVYAGLSFLMIGFIVLHYAMMRTMFANPKMWENAKEQPPFDPQEFFNIFIWFYILGAVFTLIYVVLNVVSGMFLLKRRHRLFSMVTAGLNCLGVPLGTVLGVFTLVVLTRDSVARLYAAESSPPSSHELPPLTPP
jgi:hypothetical protein